MLMLTVCNPPKQLRILSEELVGCETALQEEVLYLYRDRDQTVTSKGFAANNTKYTGETLRSELSQREPRGSIYSFKMTEQRGAKSNMAWTVNSPFPQINALEKS